MARLALAALLFLLALAPVWAAGQTARVVARIPAFNAPTSPQQARIEKIMIAAQGSPTAMAILKQAAALRPLKPIDVAFKDTGTDHGYFNYEIDALRLSKSFAKGDPRLAVPTLVHEVLHVAQHEAGTPAQALERELEAHALTLKILDELGLKDEGSFSVEARKKLVESPAAYHEWMRTQHSYAFEHSPGKRSDLISDLEIELEEAQDKLERLADGLEHDPSKQELLRRYNRAELHIASLAEDIEKLSPNGWRRYKRFSRRVQRVLEAEHARLNQRSL